MAVHKTFGAAEQVALGRKHATAALIVAGLAGVAQPAAAADYAPIDCAKASLPTEQTICRNYGLGQSEARMATLFGIVTSLVAMGQRGDIGDTQRQWLKARNQCGTDIACIAEAYKARILTLSTVMDGIASHGPF
ncbi:lysozyme inhibitor LprI family protein [Labrys okinawensis]|uniref:lysozyme inhibitor LprI family protein n=1 Tax=Labrys okinawensis TaxID=346911 RepID=UPI0039BC4F0C